MLNSKKERNFTKKTIYLLSVFILCIAGGCRSSEDISTGPPPPLSDNPNPYNYPEMNIGCVGGSIMAGGGCWPLFYGMPGYLGNILGPEISITNNAIGGSQIMADGFLQIPWQLASLINKRPEVNMIFFIGGFNDIYYAQGRSTLTTEFVNNLIGAIYNLLDMEIIGTGRSALVFTIPKLNGLPPGIDKEGADKMTAAIDTVNEAIKQMTIEINSSLEGNSPAEVILFDFAQFLENHPEYYTDHIHLNCDGYSGWASEIAALLINRISP